MKIALIGGKICQCGIFKNLNQYTHMNFEFNLHVRTPNCLFRICKLLFDDFQGMIFIHDSVIESHGKLRSSNIYIDSRWMCKIGDLPMPNFCDGEKMCDDEKNSESFSKLLLICD